MRSASSSGSWLSRASRSAAIRPRRTAWCSRAGRRPRPSRRPAGCGGAASRAASRISRRKRSGPRHGGELGPEDLERDRAIVLEVAGEVDRGHAAAAELALDRVAVAKRFGQCGDHLVGHDLPVAGVEPGGNDQVRLPGVVVTDGALPVARDRIRDATIGHRSHELGLSVGYTQSP